MLGPVWNWFYVDENRLHTSTLCLLVLNGIFNWRIITEKFWHNLFSKWKNLCISLCEVQVHYVYTTVENLEWINLYRGFVTGDSFSSPHRVKQCNSSHSWKNYEIIPVSTKNNFKIRTLSLQKKSRNKYFSTAWLKVVSLTSMRDLKELQRLLIQWHSLKSSLYSLSSLWGQGSLLTKTKGGEFWLI